MLSFTGVAIALAEQSRERLQKHLDKLVPTLYRYTFDPNPKIASAMKQVWEALVPEPKRAVAEHLTNVLKHIRDGLTDRLWRSREVRHTRIHAIPSLAVVVHGSLVHCGAIIMHLQSLSLLHRLVAQL